MGGLVDAIFGGSDAPPPPDYTPVAQASAEAARISAELGREQIAEGARQYDTSMAVAKPVADAQLELMKQSKEQGDDYFNYMKSRARPVEDALNAESMAAGSEARQEAEASRAMADARQGVTAEQDRAVRAAARYGFSPAKMAALSGVNAVSAGLGVASAGNQARERERTTGFAKKMDVAGMYRNLPGASQGAYSLALNSGNSAVQNTMAPGAARMAAIGQGTNTIMQGQGQRIQGLGSVLSAQTSYANANADQGADLGGLGSLIGAGVKFGSAMKWFP